MSVSLQADGKCRGMQGTLNANGICVIGRPDRGDGKETVSTINQSLIIYPDRSVAVRCYHVPDHYVPVCLKRPLVTTSLDSLRP